MKKILKIFLATAMAGVMLFALCVPGHAVYAKDCGLTLTKNQSYTDDAGDYVMSFTINTGRYPGSYGSYDKTKVKFILYNSAGKSVASWDEKSYNSNTQITRKPSYNYNKNLSSGTYTMKVTCTLVGESWNGFSYVQDELAFVWSYNINHTQAAIINLDKVETVYRDDGTYANKFIFGHSGAKGLTVHMEVYDANNRQVYKSSGGSPISYTSGTYSFTWGGYPSGGGLKCQSGDYTIKYWLGGKNAKQTTRYLAIY